MLKHIPTPKYPLLCVSVMLCCLPFFDFFKIRHIDFMNWQCLYLNKGDIHCIIQNKEGEFVLVGTKKQSMLHRKNLLFFSVIDTNGKTVFEKTIFETHNTEGMSRIIQTHDNHYIIAGTKYEYNRLQGFLLKIDKTGSIIEQGNTNSQQNETISDIEESITGEIWVTGSTDDNIWVAKADALNKLNKKVFFPKKTSVKMHSNSSAIIIDDGILYILATQDSAQQKNLCVIEFNIDSAVFNLDFFHTLKNAEGKAIIYDTNGSLGIIGNSYDNNYSDILFAHLDLYTNTLRKVKTYGKPFFNDKGLEIATNGDGQFVLSGTHFYNDYDKIPRAWIHITDKNGNPIDKTPSKVYDFYDGALLSVITSKQGKVIAAGYKKQHPFVLFINYPSVKVSDEDQCPKYKNQETVSLKQRITWINSDENKIDSLAAYNYNAELTAIIESTTPLCVHDIQVLRNNNKYEYQRGDGIKADNYHLTEIPPNKEYSHRYKLHRPIFIKKNNDLVRLKLDTTTSKALKIYAATTPKLYIITVGINDYENIPDLNYAKNDAESIDSVFQTQKSFFKEITCFKLTGHKNTTSDSIRNAIQKVVRTVDSNDYIILFLSGHGAILPKNNESTVIFCGKDYDKNNTSSYIEYQTHIKNPLEQTKAHVFVFIDACRNHYRDVKNLDMESSPFPDLSKAWSISNASSPTLRSFFSCSNNEFSTEDTQWQHGAFTYAFLEALNNKKVKNEGSFFQADKNKDDILTFAELQDFIVQRVPHIVKIAKSVNQNPLYRSLKNGDEDDIPIFLLSKR